jgi:hypothetical protein
MVTDDTVGSVTPGTEPPWHLDEDQTSERQDRQDGCGEEVNEMADKKVTPREPLASSTKKEEKEAATRVTKRAAKRAQLRVAKKKL